MRYIAARTSTRQLLSLWLRCKLQGKLPQVLSALRSCINCANAQFSDVDTNLFLKAALVFLSTKEARLHQSFEKYLVQENYAMSSYGTLNVTKN